MTRENRKCEKCIESTKTVESFVDGVGLFGLPKHWCTYTCKNTVCPIARKRTSKASIEKPSANDPAVHYTLDVVLFNDLRRIKGILLYDLAKKFDVSLSNLSKWVNRKEPFPDHIFLKMYEYMLKCPTPENNPFLPKFKTVAVDFDGTLVTDEYPNIGKPNKKMIQYIRMLSASGSKIILHTCRQNGDTPDLDDAVKWCEEQGIILYGVNHNPDNDVFYEEHGQRPEETKKVYADLYIDDRAISASEFIKRMDAYMNMMNNEDSTREE